ncbi:hypothetical protein C8K30_104107 [Promicromonospora sp. AC04]|uniref:NADPH-dependent F420 reductase n=1 Tax=Promicromonospora sp. AC04 TaxID=2135723 RepID=UPI000D335D32|nr:NAD(P)-binding domain-containing protein [Promicromonospora sp. AC04]PUB27660.1 hypothetical protein C8K30_104107 [Promicromonospora sp. AC04]
MKIGIIGAGKLGTTLARRAVNAGHDVVIAGRPGAAQTALVVEVMIPGATALPVTDWEDLDVAILAVPFSIALTIPMPLQPGTVVIDPTNHWAPVDGDLSDVAHRSTSEALAARHPQLQWVKSLNQLGYHDLEDETIGIAERPAMGIASDSAEAAHTASVLIASLGLDPVVIGPLSTGTLLEPGGPAFGTTLSNAELSTLLHPAEQAERSRGDVAEHVG